MSTNGSRMYGSTNGRLDVINTATRTVERTISTNSVGLSLVLNPVGSTVFVGGDGDIQEVNPATGGVRTITSLGNKNFAVSPDGQFLFLVTEYELGIKVVRVSDGALVTTIPVDCAGWGIAVSPDGLKLFDSCGPNLILVRTDTQEKQTLVLGDRSAGRRSAPTASPRSSPTTTGTSTSSASRAVPGGRPRRRPAPRVRPPPRAPVRGRDAGSGA